MNILVQLHFKFHVLLFLKQNEDVMIKFHIRADNHWAKSNL